MGHEELGKVGPFRLNPLARYVDRSIWIELRMK